MKTIDDCRQYRRDNIPGLNSFLKEIETATDEFPELAKNGRTAVYLNFRTMFKDDNVYFQNCQWVDDAIYALKKLGYIVGLDDNSMYTSIKVAWHES